jgi:hypothetical protein
MIVFLCTTKYDAKHLQANKDLKNFKTSEHIKLQSIYKQAKRYCTTSK